MKKLLLFLILFSTPLHAEVYGPKPDWEYHISDVPIQTFDQPTDNQMLLFWTLNALDVYTTDRVMRKCSDCREINPLLPKRPSLSDLIIHKAVLGTIIHYYGDRMTINIVNGILSVTIAHNYSLVN